MSHLILALDSGGTPQRWVSLKKAIGYRVKGRIQWSLGSEYLVNGGTSRMTGEMSTVFVPSIIAVRNFGKIFRSVPALTNRNLYSRDLGICGYCGIHLHPSKMTRDHIIPVSRNGLNVWSNCITSCKLCNNSKDDQLLSECGMKLLYVPYTPDRNEALLLANRNILADQMAFLRDHLPDHSRLRVN